jgi:hypothetical protein
MEAAMVETTPAPDQRISAQKLGLGLLLVVVGGLIFADAIDAWDFRILWRYCWPAILIFFGLMSEIDSFRLRRSDGGSILLAIGIWFQVGVLRLFGLNIRTAFPIGVIVFGLLLIIHALVDRPERNTKDESNHANK